MVGTVGRVTGRIARGVVGEVLLPLAGGTQAYHAYPAHPDDELPVGTQVLVVEFTPPRTVYVAPLSPS
jgi:hypothetical protein